MRHLLLRVLLITSISLPLTVDAGVIREAGRSCVFGAALLATTTYLGLTPNLLSTGPVTLPAVLSSTTTTSNAVVGCGVTAAASTAASVFTWLYDSIF